MRGGDSSRAEQNSAEAWSVNLAIYLISYFYFAGFVPEIASWWLRASTFAVLVFLVWFFWLPVLYLNSLILKLSNHVGLLTSIPPRRGQAILIASIATAMAFFLLERGALAAELGAIWLVATTVNLAAAVILTLTNGKVVD